MTLDTFFELLVWLVSPTGMRVPKHWVAEMLGTLLSSSVLTTNARPPSCTAESQTASALTAKYPPTKIDLTPFATELRRCWNAWGVRMDLAVPRPSCVFPDPPQEIVVTLPPSFAANLTHLGKNPQLAPCLLHPCKFGACLLVHRSKDVLMTARAGAGQDQYMRGRALRVLVEELGATVVERGGEFHVFSGLNWDFTTAVMRLQVCQSVLDGWAAMEALGLLILYRPDYPEVTLLHKPYLISLTGERLQDGRVGIHVVPT